MYRLPPINERNVEVVGRYRKTGSDSSVEAILSAFEETSLYVDEQDTVLHEWIDTDVIKALDGDPDPPFRLSTVIWDHPVVVTPNSATVYARTD
jgi:hypothetical protein